MLTLAEIVKSLGNIDVDGADPFKSIEKILPPL